MTDINITYQNKEETARDDLILRKPEIKIMGEYIALNSEEIGIKLKIDYHILTPLCQKNIPTRIIFIVLDTEMSTIELLLTKRYIIDLISEVYLYVRDIIFVCEGSVKVFPLMQCQLTEIVEVIESCTENKSSNFRSSIRRFFSFIQENIWNDKVSNGLIFTNGNDHNNNSSFYIIDELKDLINIKENLSLSINCITFSSNYNNLFLNCLLLSGTQRGILQFVPDLSSIKESINSVIDYMGIIKVEFFIGNCLHQHLQTITNLDSYLIIKKDKYSNDEMVLFIKQISEKKKETFIPISSIKCKQYFKDDLTGHYQFIHSTFIELEIKTIAKQVFDFKVKPLINEELDDIHRTLDKINRLLDANFQTIGRSKVESRKLVRNKILHVKRLAKKLEHNVLQYRNNQLNHDRIAQWRTLTPDSISVNNKGKKAIFKRMGKNIRRIERNEKRITELSHLINNTELHKEINSTLLENTRCAFSRVNLIEALESGDCIGLGLLVGRNDSTIFDPSKINILDISSTFISVDTFMEMLTYKIQVQNLEDDLVHGGFNTLLDSFVTSGLRNEKINAILPLYLHPKHWEISSRRSRPILAWMTTLSITGGSGSELKVIPFMVLSKCFENYLSNNTEHNLFVLKLLFETCLQVYQFPFQTSIQEDTIKKFKDYKNGALNRTIDVIPDNLLFLMRLLCAVHLKDISKEDFFDTLKQVKDELLEESIRRRLNVDWFQPRYGNNLIELMNINLDKDVNDVFEEWETRKEIERVNRRKQLSYSAYIKMLKGVEGIYNNKEDEIDYSDLPLFRFDEVNYKLSEATKYFIKDTKNYIKQDVNILLNLIDLFTIDTDLIIKQDLNEMKKYSSQLNKNNIDTWLDAFSIEQQFSIFHQSYLHRDNEVRRKAIVEGRYINYCLPEYKDKLKYNYMSNLIEKEVNETLLLKKQRYISIIKDLEDNLLATKLYTTIDLEEFAAILKYKIKYRSVRSFSYFLTKFQNEKIHNDQEYHLRYGKLIIIINGQFQQQILFLENTEWLPSNSNIRKLIRPFFIYGKIFNVNQFCTLFPKKQSWVLDNFS
ncbi:hypothetical protein K502DRAFT_125659 [Neoconidiobolus thromboides FSU 785]|nr:hypothetical protein K502DRAFT_125659 [Neoconidiobolus thromboides FSU 785]